MTREEKRWATMEDIRVASDRLNKLETTPHPRHLLPMVAVGIQALRDRITTLGRTMEALQR